MTNAGGVVPATAVSGYNPTLHYRVGHRRMPIEAKYYLAARHRAANHSRILLSDV